MADHLVRQRLRLLERLAHQHDPPARRVHLLAQSAYVGQRRQAEAAVHAVVDQRPARAADACRSPAIEVSDARPRTRRGCRIPAGSKRSFTPPHELDRAGIGGPHGVERRARICAARRARRPWPRGQRRRAAARRRRASSASSSTARARRGRRASRRTLGAAASTAPSALGARRPRARAPATASAAPSRCRAHSASSSLDRPRLLEPARPASARRARRAAPRAVGAAEAREHRARVRRCQATSSASGSSGARGERGRAAPPASSGRRCEPSAVAAVAAGAGAGARATGGSARASRTSRRTAWRGRSRPRS